MQKHQIVKAKAACDLQTHLISWAIDTLNIFQATFNEIRQLALLNRQTLLISL